VALFIARSWPDSVPCPVRSRPVCRTTRVWPCRLVCSPAHVAYPPSFGDAMWRGQPCASSSKKRQKPRLALGYGGGGHGLRPVHFVHAPMRGPMLCPSAFRGNADHDGGRCGKAPVPGLAEDVAARAGRHRGRFKCGSAVPSAALREMRRPAAGQEIVPRGPAPDRSQTVTAVWVPVPHQGAFPAATPGETGRAAARPRHF
jgi:hypothetical protein